MFLHGGVAHLVGNMIFLWLVGCLLETGCGRIYYLGIYILTGFGAAGLFWAGNMQSLTPLVGASGAIAGFMGAFTTFSTYMFETQQLLEDSQYLVAFGNLGLQNIVGLVAIILGLSLGKLI